MYEHLQPCDIANDIRMLRSSYKGAFLIVEGPVDERFYAGFIDPTSCRIKPAYSKDNCIAIIEILEADGFEGALTIVDSDFSCIDEQKNPRRNVLLTDTHDLETMLISSPALDKVISEYASSEKLKSIEMDIRELLLQIALPIGYLRWLASPGRYCLALRFEGIELNKLINWNTLQIELEAFFRAVRNNSQNRDLSDDICKEVQKLVHDNLHDPWHICCGHDLIQILTIGLKRVFGSRRAKRKRYEEIESDLRLAYEKADFIATQLYDSIVKWEIENPKYRILQVESSAV